MLNLLGSPGWRKAMNFELDQKGIWLRYERERLNWESHLQHTRNAIMEWMKPLQGDVAVYGSGWLLDVPIHELLEKFDNVYLVDINHPKLIYKRFAGFRNIHFIEADVTACAEEIHAAVTMYGRKAVPYIQKILGNKEFTPVVQVENHISVNILSQLDTLILDYLQQNIELSAEQTSSFRRAFQLNHVNFLRNQHACLITDVQMKQTNQQGEMTFKELLANDLNLPEPISEWEWMFDLQGYYKRNHVTTMKVRAFYF